MITLQIYDKNTSKDNLLNRNGLVTLSNLINCKVRERLNGEYELEFEVVMDSKVQHIKYWNIAKTCEGQLFRIYNISEDLINNTVSVKARHIFYDLDHGFILDRRAVDSTIKEAMQIAIDEEFKDLFFVDSDIKDISSLYMVEQSPLTAMFNILKRWGVGELKRDNFNISIMNPKTKPSNVEIIYKKNMLSLGKETDSDRICSRIYAKGKDGLTLPEKFVTVPINKDTELLKRHITKMVRFEDCEDIPTLRLQAQSYAESLAMPFENIKVDFLDVTNLLKFKSVEGLKYVDVGDIVTAKHEGHGKIYQLKCVYVERDLLNKENTKVELGELKDVLSKPNYDEFYSAISEAKPTLFFHQNGEKLIIENTKFKQIFREEIGILSSTHLKLFITLNGVNNHSDTNLNLQILCNNVEIDLKQVHRILSGNNVFSTTIAIPQIQGGTGESLTISVNAKTDSGMFEIDTNNAQIFVEGIGVSGGIGSGNPYVEVIEKINLHGIIKTNPQIKTYENCVIQLIQPFVISAEDKLVTKEEINNASSLNAYEDIDIQKKGE